MGEGKITKKIIQFLKSNNWHILTFDFPQSGTGRNFKPSKECFEESANKNKEHIIPDILAVKDGVMVLFENKSYFYLDDFKKINELKINNCYEDDIEEFLKLLKIEVSKKYYGIGCVDDKKFYEEAEPYYELTDFIVTVNEMGIEVVYNPSHICF